MGDEVTKKDLQSLQGYCNKQITDLEKRQNTKMQNLVDSTNKVNVTEVANINKAIEQINSGFADLTKRINDLGVVVNQHAKAINERD